jgi:hypothetical protein
MRHALVLGLSLLVVGCATPARWPEALHVPPDTTIKLPGPDTPPALRGYSGRWVGTLAAPETTITMGMIVEEIRADTASVVVSLMTGTGPVSKGSVGKRLTANVRDGALFIPPVIGSGRGGAGGVTCRLQGADEMEARFQADAGTVLFRLQRVP